MYYVYILLCSDGTYYIGSTNDIQKRLHQHNTLRSGAHYTKIRRPVVLAYSAECDTYAEARKKEGEWKRLTRAEKLEMIENNKKIK